MALQVVVVVACQEAATPVACHECLSPQSRGVPPDSQEAMEKMQRSPNQVNIIAKYFEPDQKPCQKPRSNWSCRNTDNNNMMCNETDHGQHPTIPSVTSTSRRPEMSSQSGQPNQTEQPMREHHTGHVTRISDRQPIEARPENQHGLRDEGSHIGSQEGPE